MSQKEREGAKVFERVRVKQLSLRAASVILGLSYRQCCRRYQRYVKEGEAGLSHRLRGKPSNHQLSRQRKQAIIKRYQQRYGDFGPTLAAEKLSEEGLEVGAETLRQWLLKEGLWQRARQRQLHKSWRERRSHFGALIQLDGSHHAWFEGRAAKCCLLNMVDDATGRTLSLLEAEETTFGVMRLLWRWIERYGIPVALYTDRKNVYVSSEQMRERAALGGPAAVTQFGRACQKLGIRLIMAHSPQAKGRVERNHGVYQDRLVKELRLLRLKTLAGANRILPAFSERLNEKFARVPKESQDYHRSAAGYDLAAIFCLEEDRSLSADWVVRYQNQIYQLKGQSQRRPAVGKVQVRQYLNGELHFNYRGEELSYQLLSELPLKERPQRTRTSAPKAKPSKDHPWRNFHYGKANQQG